MSLGVNLQFFIKTLVIDLHTKFTRTFSSTVFFAILFELMCRLIVENGF